MVRPMLAPRRRLATLVAAALLAAPAPALAQSAGDEQYQDPFAGEGQQPDDPVQDDAGGGQPAAPEPAAPEPVAPAAEPAPATAESGSPPAAQPQLPSTGADAGGVLLAGSILLASGVALRLRVRGRP
jgi:hypothetical protein